MKHTKTIYRSLTRMTFTLGCVLLILGLLLGMFPQPVSAVVNWDKSSLYFSGGCSGNCQEVKATVCNGADSRDMQGATAYQVYYASSGNPKNGSVVASGSIPALKSGACIQLTYNPNNVAGVYMFRAEQRPGHPGTGELWSNECSVASCQVPTTPPPPTETPTVTPTEEPTSTPTDEPTVTPTKTDTPPTKTATPPVKSPTPVTTGTPETPSTPVVTESPKTPVVTETAIGTPVSTTPVTPATLAPPAGNNTGVLIPVTGGDLSSPTPWSAASILLINLGLALLGIGLILNGINRQAAERQPR